VAKEYLKVGFALAEGVGGNGFVNSYDACGLTNCFLQHTWVQMVASDLFGFGVNRTSEGGEDVLPHPFFGGVGIFSGEGIRQIYLAIACFEILLMNDADCFQVHLQVGDKRIGEHGGAVFFAFAIADDNLMIAEVYVFDAQAQTLGQAQAAAVEDLCHELGNACHFVDNGHGFLMGEDHGQGFRFFGAEYIRGEGNVYLQDVAIQEDDGAQCLVLSRSGDMPFYGEVGDESLYFLRAHVFWVALVVEEDVALDPILVCFFGAGGVIPQGDATRCLTRMASLT